MLIKTLKTNRVRSIFINELDLMIKAKDPKIPPIKDKITE